MTNFNFWGKIIRQSTVIFLKFRVYKMLSGGGQFSSNLSNKITFFYSARRIE